MYMSSNLHEELVWKTRATRESLQQHVVPCSVDDIVVRKARETSLSFFGVRCTSTSEVGFMCSCRFDFLIIRFEANRRNCPARCWP